jgi:hypothetical protein
MLNRARLILRIDELVNRLQGDTQAWLLQHSLKLGPRIWQESYGGYAVGGEDLGEVRHNHAEELQRHAIQSDEAEFRRLCAENDIGIEVLACWQ